jgi:hypothetical protein
VDSELSGKCIGSSICVEKSESEWVFSIGGSIVVRGFLVWRLIGAEGIKVSSEDDGHRFGLPEPVNAVSRFNELVRGATIQDLTIDQRTGDLSLRLGDTLELQVLVTSIGYECWRAYEGDDFLGAGVSGGSV